MAARASLTLPLALLVSVALGSGAHAADFEDMARCSSANVKALKVFNVGQASLFRADCSAADPLAPPMRLAFGYNRTTRDGDRYTLDYDDDQSMVLRLNGEKLAEEQGEDFAQAYFSIWFGDDPYSDDLQEELFSLEP